VHHHVYASVDYVRQHGIPKTSGELDKHKILIFQGASYLTYVNMLLSIGRNENDPRIPALRVNSAYGLRRAVQAGAGIAILSDYLVAPDMNLVQIELDVETPEFDTYFVYPEELKETKRVTVFRDFIVAKAREWSF
jgi:DNA-binding transcriptional LysR family regulator